MTCLSLLFGAVLTAPVLFDLICAQSSYRIDSLESATQGVLDAYSLELGLGALQKMDILCVPKTAKSASVYFWRRAMVHGWKLFLSRNRVEVDSARAAATAMLRSEAENKACALDIAMKQVETAVKQAETLVQQAGVAQSQLELAHKTRLRILGIDLTQHQDAHKNRVIALELEVKKIQLEIQRIKGEGAAIPAETDTELVKAEKAGAII
jgi:hypothetical protein